LAAASSRDGHGSTVARRRRWAKFGRSGFVVAFISLSLIPSLLRLPAIGVITTAQVVNGFLLPCVTSLLMVSLNHPVIMGQASEAQPVWRNVLIGLCVFVTMYLASVVLMKQTIGQAFGSSGPRVTTASLPLALLGIAALCFRVSTTRRRLGARPQRGKPPLAEISLSAPPC